MEDKKIEKFNVTILFGPRNPGVRTIEEDLLKALWDVKYITEEDFNNQQNAQFQRSSRTDKGVSAARQVVSLKLREYFFKYGIIKPYVT